LGLFGRRNFATWETENASARKIHPIRLATSLGVGDRGGRESERGRREKKKRTDSGTTEMDDGSAHAHRWSGD